MNACVVVSFESKTRITCYRAALSTVMIEMMLPDGEFQSLKLNVSDATMIGATLIALANDESDGE